MIALAFENLHNLTIPSGLIQSGYGLGRLFFGRLTLKNAENNAPDA
jgi:hypothetical protein